MRNIKFRAWNKEKKIMCYEDEDDTSRYLDGWCASDVQVINRTLNSEFVKEEYDFMQYIGLKDKNGKEIYEGDILRHYITEWSYYVVVQNIDGWEIRRIKKQRSRISFHYACRLEVIGNIYENPELLKD